MLSKRRTRTGETRRTVTGSGVAQGKIDARAAVEAGESRPRAERARVDLAAVPRVTGGTPALETTPSNDGGGTLAAVLARACPARLQTIAVS